MQLGEVQCSVCNSLLHELNNTLCVHKEDFSLGFLVKSSSMAIQNVCNLEQGR